MRPSRYVLTERASYDNDYIIISLPSLYFTLSLVLSLSLPLSLFLFVFVLKNYNPMTLKTILFVLVSCLHSLSTHLIT